MNNRRQYHREYQRKRRAKQSQDCEYNRVWGTALYLWAKRKGYIKPSEYCEKCGVWNTRLCGHHPDYTKPFDVVWLCRSCHSKEHAAIPEATVEKHKKKLAELQKGQASLKLLIEDTEVTVRIPLTRLAKLCLKYEDYAVEIEATEEKIKYAEKLYQDQLT